MKVADMRDWPVSTRIAAASLVIALAIDLAALLRRQHVEQAPTLVIPAVMHIIARPIDDADLVRQAASRAPFGGVPLATTPPTSNAILQQRAVVPDARPRLLGTVMEGHDGGGFVVMELAGARVQLVRIGERAGDLRLRSVGAGEAVFDDPNDGRITLRTTPPGSGPGPHT